MDNQLSTGNTNKSHPLKKGNCICGRNVDENGRENTNIRGHGNGATLYAQEPLDTSFVHLPSPVPTPTLMGGGAHTSNANHLASPTQPSSRLKGMMSTGDDMMYNQGFVTSDQHLTNLWNALEQILINYDDSDQSSNEDKKSDNDVIDELSNTTKNTPICLDYESVKTMAYSLEDNTQRLQEETDSYIEAVRNNEAAQQRFNKALSININIQQTDDNHNNPTVPKDDDDDQSSNTITENECNPNDVVNNTIEFLSQEIKTLGSLCQQHQEEVENLDQLLSEQMLISDTQALEEHELWLEFNALEVDANAFQHVHRQLSSQLYAADQEVLALSQTSLLLHSALFDITVDERGLRYPLINNLRLSHRPKGDLGWGEINAAWSQVSQLIMFVGSTIQFTSPNLRIVPLTSSCAKIINVVDGRSTNNSGDQKKRMKIVYNLGYDGTSSSSSSKREGSDMVPSLRILYQLLEQIITHLKRTPVSTQRYDLRQLHETNDVAWSSVINSMASNLKWLSGIASDYV